MKKVLCTSLVLLLILSGITASFAAESNKTTVAAAGAATTTTTTSSAVTTTESAIVPDMTFTGTPVKLSLDAAYKKMLADSPGAQMAELNKKSAEGVAQGYQESVKSINDAETNPAAFWQFDNSNKPMLRYNRSYATTQGPKNYEAEINKLKTDTLDNYYTLKELENQVIIAKDNLALKEKLLSNTQLKFKLGTVSKNDVLKAEVAAYEAKDQLTAAENGLSTMKMSFNQFMGYGLMQNVVLTDTIEEIPLSVKTLQDSIKSALVNRNEIAEASYNMEMTKLSFANYSKYPSTSSKYIAAKMAMLNAETGFKNAPMTVENDVRTKYMAMYQKYSAVQTGKKSVENSKETLRLTQLQYDSGMATFSDVESAQLGYFNQQIAYSKALLEYRLAVNDYDLSSGVGVKAATIK